MSNPFWPTFIPLLTAHLLADFVLQSDDDVARKHQFPVLLKHVLIVAGTSYVLLGVLDAWLPIAVIFATHLGIDYAKIRAGRYDLTALVIDQLSHVVVIAVAAVVWQNGSVAVWAGIFGPDYLRVLGFSAGLIAVVRVGAIVVGTAVEPFLLQMRESREESSQRSMPRHGFEQGGRVIGQLERALIFLFVLANQLSAVGFLIAAKSILRFGEVKDRSHRMEAEYIIIGTLISFLWGLAAAFATRWLVLR